MNRGVFAVNRCIDGPPPRKPARACIIVGWNQTPASTAALRYAVGLADLLTAHAHVVHVVDIEDIPVDPDSFGWESRFAATLDKEASSAQALLDGLEASWTYHILYGRGSPGDSLSAVAEAYHALIVVVGSPRGGLMSFLDGVVGQSVSHRLITRRHIPLLVVPVDSHVTDPRMVWGGESNT